MRHVFCRKVVFLLAALLVVCGMSARKPIKTLLITGQNNHNWQVSHVVLKQILENGTLLRGFRGLSGGREGYVRLCLGFQSLRAGGAGL